VDSLYVAVITADTASAYTAGTPAFLAPAGEASQAPATSFGIQYADDQPFDVMSSEAETKIALKVTNIDPATLALITGKVFDVASGRMWDGGGTAPYMALGWRSKKSNGKYRYYWFLKGKFDMPQESAQTEQATPTPQTLDMTFTAIRTVYKFELGTPADDTIKRVLGDEDTTNFSATGWFSQVQTPVVTTPSALALSSSDPADDASGVAVNKVVTLTFNNALPAAAIYNVIFATAAGVRKAVTCVLDATKKIMTCTPGSNWAGSTTYVVAIGVTDIYGSVLQTAVNFATT
jgi:phi13 family phage major tail protein